MANEKREPMTDRFDTAYARHEIQGLNNRDCPWEAMEATLDEIDRLQALVDGFAPLVRNLSDGYIVIGGRQWGRFSDDVEESGDPRDGDELTGPERAAWNVAWVEANTG